MLQTGTPRNCVCFGLVQILQDESVLGESTLLESSIFDSTPDEMALFELFESSTSAAVTTTFFGGGGDASSSLISSIDPIAVFFRLFASKQIDISKEKFSLFKLFEPFLQKRKLLLKSKNSPFV